MRLGRKKACLHTALALLDRVLPLIAVSARYTGRTHGCDRYVGQAHLAKGVLHVSALAFQLVRIGYVAMHAAAARVGRVTKDLAVSHVRGLFNAQHSAHGIGGGILDD